MKVVCICGHVRGVHPTEPVVSESGASDRWCGGGDWQGCGCEGWTLPAKSGAPLLFGRDRLPMRVAERAPAWSRGGDE